jgi:hypothetical protein
MRYNDNTDTDLSIITHLDALGVFIIDKDVVTDEDVGPDLHAAGTMQHRAQRGGTGAESGKDMKETIINASDE